MNKTIYSLTNPQKSIFLTEQYYANTNINNICGTAIISNKIDFKILNQAINFIIKTNDSFLLRFNKSTNILTQELIEFKEQDIEVVNLNSIDEVSNLENKLLKKLFDLENDTYEFKMFKFPDSTGGFLLNIHHLVSDAWTLGLTCRKIVEAYNNLLNNLSIEINKEQSYLKYIETEENYKNSPKFIKDKEYWENTFSNIPDIINLPSSQKNSNLSFSCKANRVSFMMPKNKVLNISNFCLNHNISPFNLFTSALAILIHKVSNSKNFVIGTPILNRTNFNEKNTTGMFINISPLLININENQSILDFLKEIATNSLGLLRHQRYPYSEILKYIRTKDSNFPTLFNTLLSYQVTKANNVTDLKYITRWAFNGTCADDLDIQIYDLDDTNELNIAYDYKISKFNKSDITKIHNQLENIINQIINNEDIKLNEISLISNEEKHHLLYDFNKTKFSFDKEKTIAQLFEEQVIATPNNIAVTFENNKISYKDLNEKANQIANSLRKNYDIKSGDFVSLILNRSIDLIATILGIVKSGATYVAVDPDYPEDRIDYMLSNCNSKLIFMNNNTKHIIKDINIPKLNINNNDIYKENKENLSIISNANDLLYVIYTSGSTGTPKGVSIKNYNVHNFVLGMRKFLDYSKVHSMVSVATVCFDMFVFELWGTLLNGLNLVLANENEQKLPNLLDELCVKNNVDIFQTTPSRFNLMIFNNTIKCFSTVKHIFVGGEAVPKTLFDKFLEYPNLQIHHMYGPTETTVWSTGTTITNSEKITIGKPIINTQVYILDENKEVVPTEVAGEIYISGDGVGNGYLNNKEKNSQTFIENPFVPGTLMYKTGDLGLFNNNGEIIYLNRKDNQVKVRGYRIELGEIEKIILSFKDIKNCVVCKKVLNDMHEILCAYYLEKNEVDISAIKKELQSKLPIYMIPQYYIKLEDFPYTQNGKIDRKNLPLPTFTQKETTSKVRNDTDKKLIEILSKLLGNTNIEITDNLFELGMDSLIAINLSVKILNEFNIQLTISDIFNNPTLKELSDVISKSNRTDNILKIEKAPEAEFYPLSNAEKRIYYTTLMDNNNSILYNVNGGIIFNKKPNLDYLNYCIKKVLNNHEAFKTYFIIENNNLVQKIKEDINFELRFEKSNTSDIHKLFKEFIKPFDLSLAPLFRAKLVELKENKFILMMDTHHIICDGSSLNIFIKDLVDTYNNIEIEKPLITYKDYVLWESNIAKSNSLNKSEEFWINQFKDELPILNLPTTYVRPANRSSKGNTITKILNEITFNKIKDISQKYGLTPNIILLCAYYILLYKYTHQTDIIIGTPVNGRTLPELNNIIGMFVNTLPLRAKFDKENKIMDFLNEIKEICANAYSNQNYSFDSLVHKINAPRDNSRNFIFDVLFTYQTNRYTKINLNEMDSELYIPNSETSKFDISLEILPLEKEFLINFEYSTSLFDEEYINNFSQNYLNTIDYILDNLNNKISQVNILSNKSRNKILNEFNNTEFEYNKNQTLSKLFENQVKKTPNNTAIVFENGKMSYSELNERANQVARTLLKLGLDENSIIGIVLPRSFEILICMLGALKAGVAYIPIDPTLPLNRIEYMLTNSNSKTILTITPIANDLNKELHSVKNIIDVNLNTSTVYKENKENLDIKINPNSASYSIYTSGSTGTPKGVLLDQKALANLANYLNEKVEFFKDEYKNTSIISITTISFDIFIFETLLSLQRGLKIIMTNESEQNTPTLLDKLIEKENIKCIQTTPSRMALFVKNIKIMPHLKNLDYVVLAGEPLPIELKNNLLKLGIKKVYNGYGPSETTVFSTFTDVTDYQEITIGKPINNTQIYILDSDLSPVPDNCIGEIYISGDGVALKYINNPKITNERFIKNPFKENSVMYKTGDLAKFLPNGELAYLGRVDNQVKIRGLRIELEEIEKCTLKYKNIEKCIVTVKHDSRDREFLVAYLIVNERISITRLREFLKTLLPKYMIPSYFMVLDKLPYLPNGKINKKALPEPNIQAQESSKNYVAPQTDLEVTIVNIFQNLLSISPIGINDNFFELGGDSLLAINLQIELSKLEHSSITYSDIFLNPTVSDLVKKISEKTNDHTSNLNKKDFEKYEKILNKNTKLDIINKNQNLNNILITGTTGFLGSHILEEFLKNEKGIAYCIVRKEPGMTLHDKFRHKLNYYFGDKYNNLIDTRIKIVNGDISKPSLGMTELDLYNIFSDITCVVNSAATVSHYGKYQLFKNINVDGVENLLNICQKYNKKFFQISTISISGIDSNDQAIENDSYFDESSLYINQSLNNVYVKSKFEAEKLVLNYILNGTDAYILRVGNLMNRFSDFKFQPNFEENAFINRIKSFINIGYAPDYLINEYLEFTPVDSCAQAIYKIIKNPSNHNRIFHLFNNNHVKLKDFIDLVKNYKSFEFIDNKEFLKIIDNLLNKQNSDKIISGILKDFDKNRQITYRSNITVSSDFTNNYLNEINFKWPIINKTYLESFIKYILK